MRLRLILFILLVSAILGALPVFASESSQQTVAERVPSAPGEAHIDFPKPDERGGKAYRLTYRVSVALEVFWLFKTDFDNDFLTTNKYIKSHVLIKKEGRTVITENTYSHGPNRSFRWRTKILPEKHRLTFELINPEECGQKFHYGYIQLTALGSQTLVTQVAYFDFWGVSLWVQYPWRGGMEDFLRYTAAWEQQTVSKRRAFYRSRLRPK